MLRQRRASHTWLYISMCDFAWSLVSVQPIYGATAFFLFLCQFLELVPGVVTGRAATSPLRSCTAV
eukprot:6214769-Pleurochrysis_carterae.AAC.3